MVKLGAWSRCRGQDMRQAPIMDGRKVVAIVQMQWGDRGVPFYRTFCCGELKYDGLSLASAIDVMK